jgi:hypothetical protein
MKKLIPVILLFLCSCASLDQYQVGEYSVFITSRQKVNEEYQKVCVFNCSRAVQGFVNFEKKEMWSIQNLPVVIHEIKHIVEGHFHEKQVSLQ